MWMQYTCAFTCPIKRLRSKDLVPNNTNMLRSEVALQMWLQLLSIMNPCSPPLQAFNDNHVRNQMVFRKVGTFPDSHVVHRFIVSILLTYIPQIWLGFSLTLADLSMAHVLDILRSWQHDGWRAHIVFCKRKNIALGSKLVAYYCLPNLSVHLVSVPTCAEHRKLRSMPSPFAV